MPPDLFPELASSAALQVETFVEPFEKAHQAGQRPDLEAFLPVEDGLRRAVLRELVHIDLEYRLKAGAAARVEEYLVRYPELAADRAVIVALIRSESELRRRRQSSPPFEEYLARFLQWEAELQFLRPVGRIGNPSYVPETSEVLPSFLEQGGRLGKFELLEVAGRGACGIVYRARDTELDRIVAVKVPRLTTFVIAEDRNRFLREARSAARLKHPGIVAVYEAGQIGETCFLASEFVPGSTLADKLEAGFLPPPEAARLLAHVADALHYAHEQGVVHRDIKRSNIMLSPVARSPLSVAKDQESSWADHGSRTTDHGLPMVMDFGLARRDGSEATVTQDGQVLGTPAYMSPEQARGEAHRVDGRGDVYSLGVILYQLLTEALPFRGNARIVLHQVLHDEPRPPSSLNDCIPRDLETICLKAMAKEPERRYPTAGALGDDLRRFLRGEPILARPVRRRERLWRWCRRNPGLASLTGTTAAALVCAVVILAASTFLIARKQAETAAAYAAETAQRERMEANLLLALQAVHKMDTEVAEEWLARELQKEQLRRQFLRQAVEFYQAFARENSSSPEVRQAVGRAHLRLGDIHHTLGEHEQARQADGQAITIFSELAAEFPEVAHHRHDLAASHHELGFLFARDGERPAAWEHYKIAFDLWTKLAADYPGEPSYRQKLADSHRQFGFWLGEGRVDELAEVAHYRQAHDLRSGLVTDFPSVPQYRKELADNHVILGRRFTVEGNPADAAAHLREALALHDQLVVEFPDRPEYRQALSKTHYHLASILSGHLNDRAAALEHLGRAIALQAKLAADFPTVPIIRFLLACSHLKRAEGGDLATAEAEVRQAIELLTRVVAELPSLADFRRELADAHQSLGGLLNRQGKKVAAEAEYRKSITVASRLAADGPMVPTYVNVVASGYMSLALLLQETGRLREAEQAFRQALAQWRKLASEFGLSSRDQNQYRTQVAVCHYRLALLHSKAGSPRQAAQVYQEAVALVKKQDLKSEELRRLDASVKACLKHE